MAWRRFGARIKALRIEQGLTQEALGRRARLSRMYIQMLERGERVSPSLPALERIARALGARLRVDIESRREE